MGPTHSDWFIAGAGKSIQSPAMILTRYRYAKIPAAFSRLDLYTEATVESERNNRISRERCLTEQEPGEYRKIPYQTCSGWQQECHFSVPGSSIFRCSWGRGQPRSIMAAFQQLLQPSSRGKADYRFAGAPCNTQHNPFNRQGLALSTFYRLIHKSILELGEEVMQKEPVL